MLTLLIEVSGKPAEVRTFNDKRSLKPYLKALVEEMRIDYKIVDAFPNRGVWYGSNDAVACKVSSLQPLTF